MGVKISRVLHATYIFECEETRIIFDPIFENPFSGNCYAYPPVKFEVAEIEKLQFSAVFISHYHEDHCSLTSLNFINRQTPIYIYCLHLEMISLIKALGFSHVEILQIGEPIQVGEFEITAKLALDADVDSIFHIKAQGLNILNVVDAWIDPRILSELARYQPWDLILWPYQPMREIEVLSPLRFAKNSIELPSEWFDQLRVLKPHLLVPSSCQFIHEPWSWYNHALFPISYREFQNQAQISLPGTKVLRLHSADSITLDKKSSAEVVVAAASLKWLKTTGERDVDYEYWPDLKPPSTKEIAQNFRSLSESERERVFDYCQNGLRQKYELIGVSSEPFFAKSRRWQLSLYDHRGDVIQFNYQIYSGKIIMLNNQSLDAEWLTELPITKLFAALFTGESLTSMYVRINDQTFNEGLERELKGADIMEDPLLRCLFTGNFAAYQKAQLSRLLTSNDS